jgi:Protein of unknown function (DUF1549)/Protein of unknown function (DUF1553)
MQIAKAWIAIVFMVAAARADGPGQRRGEQSDSVDPARFASDARALTTRIDGVLAGRWAAARTTPAPVADDGEFLRRVSLDLIGKIPTAAEARDFLDDPGRDKRLALVERLLDSPAYTTHATEIWRKLILPEADTDDQARAVAGGFETWLRKKVIEEAGYDKIVREILTARMNRPDPQVPVFRVDPSPAAYFAAKGGKPENIASGVASVFLGLRLECAQCHKHPFADWTREQFWSLAAFFAALPAESADSNAAMMQRGRSAKPIRELTIPGTKQVVKATHLDGSTPAWRPRADTREILAEWVTSPDNPYFARAVVNRVWARFFGVGLIEPANDLESEADPELSRLLDVLAGQFRSHGYNLKFLIRVLTATRAYNLSSAAAGQTETAGPLFASMPVRGLGAGQLFDSLTRATGSEQIDARARFLELFAGREDRPVEAETTIIEALSMMNGSYVEGATNPETSQALAAIVKAPFLDTPGRIETLYLATLTRRPKPQERSLLMRFVDKRKTAEEKEKAFADIFWAILNGPEFHLNH